MQCPCLGRRDSVVTITNFGRDTRAAFCDQHPQSPNIVAIQPLLRDVVIVNIAGSSVRRELERRCQDSQSLALSGVRDEAEICGHRRTYVASGPGLLAQALRNAAWILLSYCESYNLALHCRGFNDSRDETDN